MEQHHFTIILDFKIITVQSSDLKYVSLWKLGLKLNSDGFII